MKQLMAFVLIAGFFYSGFIHAAPKKKWNRVCQGLLDNSVRSTLKLEKSVQKKKRISRTDFENKIQNELLVVQLNAWVCGISSKDKKGVVAEEQFLKDYSQLVQSKKL